MLDRMIFSGAAAASISARTLALSSARSGMFSCTTSASRLASAALRAKRKLCTGTPKRTFSPRTLSVGHAAATILRVRSSASTAGSNATTSSPWARNRAIQLAPTAPVPITATERTSSADAYRCFILVSTIVIRR